MHVHNTNPATGPVCSFFLTDEVLISLGIVKQRTSKCVGIDVIEREGMTASEARVAIHEHPMIRTCTVCPTKQVRKPVFRQTEAMRVEALAFANSILRTPATACP